jgi:hypothetical protein
LLDYSEYFTASELFGCPYSTRTITDTDMVHIAEFPEHRTRHRQSATHK